jgi:hypothetical protein
MPTPVKHELITHEKSMYDDHWSIRIAEGAYQGVVYQYDTVSLETRNGDEDDVFLTFNTITLENPDNLDLTAKLFEDTVGDILTSIIEEHLESQNLERDDD